MLCRVIGTMTACAVTGSAVGRGASGFLAVAVGNITEAVQDETEEDEDDGGNERKDPGGEEELGRRLLSC